MKRTPGCWPTPSARRVECRGRIERRPGFRRATGGREYWPSGGTRWEIIDRLVGGIDAGDAFPETAHDAEFSMIDEPRGQWYSGEFGDFSEPARRAFSHRCDGGGQPRRVHRLSNTDAERPAAVTLPAPMQNRLTGTAHPAGLRLELPPGHYALLEETDGG